MKVLRLELYRAFHSRTFLISLLIGLSICILDLVTFCIRFGGSGSKVLLQAWIGTDYQFAYNEMFYTVLPILACLPYGGSLYTDMKTGYEKNICIKTSRSQYALAKGIAVFLSAFVSVALPLAMNLFVAAGFFPNFVPERLEFMSIGLRDIQMFTLIYSYHPAIYCVIFILIDALFAGAIALTSLSIARLAKSHFTAVVTPMVIYILSSMLLEGNQNNNWSVLGMLNPRQYLTTRWYQMLIVYLAIFAVNSTIIWITSRKRDVL